MSAIGPAARPQNGNTTRLRNVIAALLIGVFLILGWTGRSTVEIASGDELTYLALSQSLEDGSYREIYRASAPLHVQYPPGYPAWLVLVRHAVGERLELIPAVNLLLVAGALLMVFVAARALLGGWLALAILLLLVLNPGMLWTGGSYYSEALFLFFSTASIYSALRAESEARRGWLLAAMTFALLSFLTRAAGLAVIAAVVLWLVSHRRKAALAVFAASSALVVGGWFAYTVRAQSTEPVRTYGSDFLTGGVEEHPNVARELSLRVLNNAREYITEIVPVEMSMPTVEGTVVDNLLWLLFSLACLSVGVAVLWRQWRAAALYLAMAAGMLLLWSWAINRLIEPLTPLLLLTLFAGASATVRRFLPSRAGNAALALVTALLAVGSARGAIAYLGETWDCDRTEPYTSAGCYEPETLALIAAVDHVRRTSSANDVVLAWRPSSVHFLSTRRAESATLVGRVAAGELADTLRARGIRYALLTGINEFERGIYARALASSCTDFRVDGRFDPSALLLVTRAPGDRSDDACAEIAEYQGANPELRDDRR